MRDPDKLRAGWRRKQRRRKARALSLLGSRCRACGTTELAILDLDHIHDVGALRRRLGEPSGGHLHQRLLAGGRRDHLQILCASCNRRKRVYGSNPKKWKAQRKLYEADAAGRTAKKA